LKREEVQKVGEEGELERKTSWEVEELGRRPMAQGGFKPVQNRTIAEWGRKRENATGRRISIGG